VIDRAESLAGLAARAGGDSKVRGLTLTDDRFAVRTRLMTRRSGRATCAWIEEAVVDLTPASVTIFVPRDYPEGSCEHDAVLAHEREHVATHRERLEAAATEMRAALASARWLPLKGNPIESGDPAAAQAALEERLRKVLLPVHEKFRADLRAAQADLDRPDLYEWWGRRCASWK
jgi:hypothetical protein